MWLTISKESSVMNPWTCRSGRNAGCFMRTARRQDPLPHQVEARGLYLGLVAAVSHQLRMHVLSRQAPVPKRPQARPRLLTRHLIRLMSGHVTQLLKRRFSAHPGQLWARKLSESRFRKNQHQLIMPRNTPAKFATAAMVLTWMISLICTALSRSVRRGFPGLSTTAQHPAQFVAI
jgi:hypothetical protein